ncbi:hypothetical protein HKX48_007787 [Thoreauomyces humboldtii]|nr:hypothetical protein HKX48_007787 [Thoreauomyces humboldtii]
MGNSPSSTNVPPRHLLVRPHAPVEQRAVESLSKALPKDIASQTSTITSSASFTSASSWEAATLLHARTASTRTQLTGVFSPFQSIPLDLVLTILHYMHPHSLHRLAQTSKALHSLITENLESLYRHRVLTWFRLQSQRRQHTYRMSYEGPMEQTWCDMFWRLSVCRTRWVGCALDRATNQFEPYPMELVVKNAVADGSHVVRIEGVCRWRTVGDAIIKMKGVVDMDDGRSGAIAFREYKLLRGPVNTIAIPNKYRAACFGSVMLGMYDPQSSRSARGVFCIVMEECFWGGDESEAVRFDDRRTYFGVITTVDAAETGVYCQCHLTFTRKDGHLVGDFVLPDANQVAKVTLSNDATALHFDADAESATGPAAWWEAPVDPCVPDGRVTIKKMGNVLLGTFSQPTVGCFYIGL